MADAAAAAAASAANNANLLRDAVTRIPIWTGEGNDLFTPDQWLARVEKARTATNWNDEQTMSFIESAYNWACA